MREEYVSDQEYPTYYRSLNGVRAKIARDLPIDSGMFILDTPTGSGYFAIEVALRDETLNVVGIDIAETDIARGRDEVVEQGLKQQMAIVRMDATKMGFRSGVFDMATNFMGLEDIHMTRGRAGVASMFSEVGRVLKLGGYFCLAIMPPEEMETEAQKLEVAAFEDACGAKWLSVGEYEELLNQAGFRLVGQQTYHTGKKLTPQQAREEIGYACEFAPQVYGVESRSFDEVWAKYGSEIDEHGLGHYSKIALLRANKVR